MVAQTGHRVEKTVTHSLYSAELGLLWVNNGLSRPTAATSAFRGKADANDAKADVTV